MPIFEPTPEEQQEIDELMRGYDLAGDEWFDLLKEASHPLPEADEP
jgi:hypothetical protein